MDLNKSAKVKEAETYRSMGLLEESLSIYEELLSSDDGLEDSTRNQFKSIIADIGEEMEKLEKEYENPMAEDEIAIIRDTLLNIDEVPNILDSASAFMELGLYQDALREYEKLLTDEFVWQDVLKEISICLLKWCGPSGILKTVQEMVERTETNESQKAEIVFRLGLEMHKRDLHLLANELCGLAKKSDPDNEEIKKWLDSNSLGKRILSKYDHLIIQSKINPKQLQKALELSKKTEKSIEFILINHFKIKTEELGKSLSLFYHCPFRQYDANLVPPSELIHDLKKIFILNSLWVPVALNDKTVEILIDDPFNITKTDQIQTLLKSYKINFSVGIKEDIEKFIQRFFNNNEFEKVEYEEKNLDESAPIIETYVVDDKEEEIEDDAIDETSSEVVRLINQIISTAYQRNVSDIHFEPFPDSRRVNIRFRKDGICYDYTTVPLALARGITSRIKIMANLDIAERRLPQDGKIKFRRKGMPSFELRVATMPTTGGYEDTVLRILAKANALALDEVGLTAKNLNTLKAVSTKPYGLFLVVGPTGSGKTTTLHAALDYINKPGIKIWTAEDPVEITQPRLRQVEAKPRIGLDFPRIMRSFLRADPDVIMIGEMRDKETASTALEASLTGHLVFSTLHTNNSAETITRLLDMGFNSIYFADALLGVLAQRLVRRLCPNCKTAKHLSDVEIEEIITEYGRDQFNSSGIEITPDLKIFKPKGCDKCSNIGYSGRVAIHEMLENTDEIKKLIKKKEGTETIAQTATNQGMTTLKQDGILKVFDGLTDLSEVRRVCIK